jgi:hypothetical protein
MTFSLWKMSSWTLQCVGIQTSCWRSETSLYGDNAVWGTVHDEAERDAAAGVSLVSVTYANHQGLRKLSASMLQNNAPCSMASSRAI